MNFQQLSLARTAALTIVSLLLGTFPFVSFAQQLSLNPYSRYGVGDVLTPSSPRNWAMGGAGIATTSYFTVNRINPATWADLAFSTIDASGFGHISQFKSKTSSERQSTGSFQNVGFAFPSNKGVVFAFGFAPTTAVGYNITTTSTFIADGAPAVTTLTYKGSGGLNQGFIGAATKFFHKHLLAGASLNFNFGEINNKWNISTDQPGALGAIVEKSTYLNGPGIQLGAVFTDTLHKAAFKALPEKDRRQPIRYRIGAVIDYTSSLKGDLFMHYKTFAKVGTQVVQIGGDTLRQENGTVKMPFKAGIGTEIGRAGKYSLTAEVMYQNWNSFQSFGQKDTNLSNDFRVSIGGEYVPNINSPRYLGHVAYRAGAYFHQTPLVYTSAENGKKPVNDYGVTVGIGIPPARGTSSMNISAAFGKRGSLAVGHPLEELYVRLQVGVIINERWFVRRVVD